MIKYLLIIFFIAFILQIKTNAQGLSSKDTISKQPTSGPIVRWFGLPEPPFDTIPRNFNRYGFTLFYGTRGIGASAGMYKWLSNDADLTLFLSFYSASEKNEDGGEKQYRVLTLPFSAGILKYFYQNKLGGKIKPSAFLGLTAALILAAPSDKGFFKSLTKSRVTFGVGSFVGFGIDYQPNDKYAVFLNFRYSFLPIVGKEIMLYKDKPIKFVGGLQFTAGFNLLRRNTVVLRGY